MHLQVVPSAARPAVPAGVLGFAPEQGAARHLAAIGSLRTVPAGHTLFSEGEEARGIYEVTHGTVRLCKLLPDGRRQIVGFLSAGQILGLAPEGLYVFTAEAITPVKTRHYPRATLERLIDDVPGFARRLLAVASHELQTAQEQMLLLGRKSAAERVASFLLQIADRSDDGSEEVEIPMTRIDIADYLGLTIETVSRTLSKLRQDRLIALTRSNRVKIRDRDELEQLAAGAAKTEL